MFGRGLRRTFAMSSVLTPFCMCDEIESKPSLVEQADAAIDEQKPKIKQPIQFENLRNVVGQSSVNAFDGFRVMVQKQVNLNTVVTHFYWIGSQATGQPIYQYRLIFPIDDKFVNVATDMDMNIEGEIKVAAILPTQFPGVGFKSNFAISEQTNHISGDLDFSSETCTAQLSYARSDDNAVSLSYMQSLTPYLQLGGKGKFSLSNQKLKTAVGGVFEQGDLVAAALWDDELKVMLLRKVNPNRVHLATELLIAEKPENNQVAVNAEFTLKQSKINLSIDSKLLLKSTLETTVSSGTTLQLSAEMSQFSNHYRFGYGLTMG